MSMENLFFVLSMIAALVAVYQGWRNRRMMREIQQRLLMEQDMLEHLEQRIARETEMLDEIDEQSAVLSPKKSTTDWVH